MPSLAAAALVALAALQSVHAWGVLGHATVAHIAQHYLTDSTASWAQDVLGNSSSSYLAGIASWADEYRATKAGAWSAPFHFIDAEDTPPSTCNVDYGRDCGSSGCSISAVANYTRRVKDKRLDHANVAQALKFLVHFVGDLTQPLHDEAYEVGGNDVKVTFDGFKDNLHADWDTYMPEKLVGGVALSDAQTWAATLVREISSGSYEAQARGIWSECLRSGRGPCAALAQGGAPGSDTSESRVPAPASSATSRKPEASCSDESYHAEQATNFWPQPSSDEGLCVSSVPSQLQPLAWAISGALQA